MKLNDWFDNIYIINLEHRTDRWEHCVEQMKKHDFTAEQFKAIGRSDLINGWQACTLSHIAVLDDAKSRGLTRILVLEDDFVFAEHFNQVFELPQHLLWDIFYLGVNHQIKPEEISEYYDSNFKRVIKGLTSHAVAYNNVQDIERFLSFAKSLNHVIDECLFYYFQTKGTAYCYYPNLAWQLGGYSDIEQRNMYYEWLKPQ